MVGTALTTGVAYIDLGPFQHGGRAGDRRHQDAARRSLLHAREIQHGPDAIVIIAGFFWLGIMISLTLSDELTRTWEIPGSLDAMIVPLISHLFLKFPGMLAFADMLGHTSRGFYLDIECVIHPKL